MFAWCRLVVVACCFWYSMLHIRSVFVRKIHDKTPKKKFQEKRILYEKNKNRNRWGIIVDGKVFQLQEKWNTKTRMVKRWWSESTYIKWTHRFLSRKLPKIMLQFSMTNVFMFTVQMRVAKSVFVWQLQHISIFFTHTRPLQMTHFQMAIRDEVVKNTHKLQECTTYLGDFDHIQFPFSLHRLTHFLSIILGVSLYFSAFWTKCIVSSIPCLISFTN